MGYGQNLKKHLDEKGIKVSQLASITGINASTLYAIIQRDSPVRYDFALRIANVIEIPISDICKENPFQDDEIPYPPEKFENEPAFITALLADSRAGTTAKYHLKQVLKILGVEESAKVEQLITSYARLNDDGRKALFDFVNTLEKNLSDPKRVKKVAEIKNFKG